MKGLATLAVVASLLAAAAPAVADRAPTPTERQALAHAAGIRERCAGVRISTARQRYKWATVGTRERCLEGGRFSQPQIFRRKRESGAPWRLRWSYARGCDALYERVPQRVLDDFGMGCTID